MPQRDVLHRRNNRAAHDPGEARQILGQYRVALARHRRRALLPGREILPDLAHFGALEVADLALPSLSATVREPGGEAFAITATGVPTVKVGSVLPEGEEVAPVPLRDPVGVSGFPWEWVVPLAVPVLAGVTRAPSVGLLMLVGGFATLCIPVLVHLLTLPTEFDASFGRALPLIRRHGLLQKNDLPRARKLLTAAALTYVSGALQSLLNIARWFSILRR